MASIRAGRHTIVSTGTASGKSLCFNLPVFETLLADRKARALYLYPTKSLAQDQLRAIRAFAIPQVSAATYDGDTPPAERGLVRRYARIVLSNPDMVHRAVLPQHQRWASFFRRLRFVVIDECHHYRGMFGSHVSLVLRRLRRICAATPTSEYADDSDIMGQAKGLLRQVNAPHKLEMGWIPDAQAARVTEDGEQTARALEEIALLEHHHVRLAAQRELVGERQPHDAAADDHDVRPLGHGRCGPHGVRPGAFRPDRHRLERWQREARELRHPRRCERRVARRARHAAHIAADGCGSPPGPC